MAFTPVLATGWEMGSVVINGIPYFRSGTVNIGTGGDVHTGNYCLKLGNSSAGPSFYKFPYLSLNPFIMVLWNYPGHGYGRQVTRINFYEGDLLTMSLRFILFRWDLYDSNGVKIQEGVVPLENKWHHLQFFIDLTAANGIFKTKTDGIPDIDYEGSDIPGFGSINMVELFNNNHAVDYGQGTWFDNLVIGTGSTVNDMPGDLRADGLYPNADTATVEWDLSSGLTAYELLNPHPPNDASYIHTTVDDQDTLVELDDWDSTDKSPQFVIAWSRGWKDDASASRMKILDSDGINERESDSKMLLTAPQYQSQLRLTAPDAGSWTPANINSLKLGVKSQIIP